MWSKVVFPTLTTSRYRPVESFKMLLQLIGFGTDCLERRSAESTEQITQNWS